MEEYEKWIAFREYIDSMIDAIIERVSYDDVRLIAAKRYRDLIIEKERDSGLEDAYEKFLDEVKYAPYEAVLDLNRHFDIYNSKNKRAIDIIAMFDDIKDVIYRGCIDIDWSTSPEINSIVKETISDLIPYENYD